MKIKDIFRVTRGSVLAADKVLLSKIDGYEYPVYSSQTKADGLLGYYNTYLYENAITWTTDGANAGTVHYRAGKFYCTNVCGVLLNKDGYANRCTAAILGSISKKYVSYVGNPKLMNNIMSEIPIIIPALEEQHKIDSFIAVLDKRIKAQQMMITSLKKYKRGLVNDIFSQRIVPYGERDEWTILPFREVVTINPKTGPLPDEFIYLDLECVNSGKVCAVNIIKRENAPSRAQRLLEKNDVLYQMVRPYQQNNYYYDNTFSSPVVASTGYAQIKCGACDPLFVYEQISSERFAKEAMLRSTGTSYPAINADDLGEIPFFLPSTHIQKKIGAILSLVNQKIFKSEEELQLLKSTKSSLLQQLFI